MWGIHEVQYLQNTHVLFCIKSRHRCVFVVVSCENDLTNVVVTSTVTIHKGICVKHTLFLLEM